MKKPNVLFILSDQHHAQAMGNAGHPVVRTPHLDRLAEAGVKFDCAIAQNPICTPSRVSFLSGQYPHNHGYFGLEGAHPGGLPNIIGHFRRAGYRTAAVGKIHCPEYWIEDDCDLFAELYSDCSIEGGGEYREHLRGKGLEALRDDEFYPEQTERLSQSCDGRASSLCYEDSVEGWTAGKAIRFMTETAEEGRPFFAFVGFPRPHQVYAPSEPFWSMYDRERMELPPNAEYAMEGKAPHLIRAARKWKQGNWTQFEPRDHVAGLKRKMQGYFGCVSQVDHAVGQLLESLRDLGIEDNTIVVYTSDHGDYVCQHGLIEKAPGICSDAVTRIPMIWRWPGRCKAGHVSRQTVEAVDVSQTLCGWAGLDPMETSDGTSIVRLLQGEEREIRSIGVTEFLWSKSVRMGSFRMVYYPADMFPDEYPDGFGELYDLEQDPWEMRNLYFEPPYRSVVERMTRKLMDWLVTTTRPRTVLGTRRFTGLQVKSRFHNTVNADGKVSVGRVKELRGSNYL